MKLFAMLFLALSVSLSSNVMAAQSSKTAQRLQLMSKILQEKKLEDVALLMATLPGGITLKNAKYPDGDENTELHFSAEKIDVKTVHVDLYSPGKCSRHILFGGSDCSDMKEFNAAAKDASYLNNTTVDAVFTGNAFRITLDRAPDAKFYDRGTRFQSIELSLNDDGRILTITVANGSLPVRATWSSITAIAPATYKTYKADSEEDEGTVVEF